MGLQCQHKLSHDKKFLVQKFDDRWLQDTKYDELHPSFKNARIIVPNRGMGISNGLDTNASGQSVDLPVGEILDDKANDMGSANFPDENNSVGTC